MMQFQWRTIGLRIEGKGIAGMSHDHIGNTVGSFRLEKLIGAGSTCLVYRAKHETTGRAVAIKMLNTQFSGKPSTEEVLNREAEVLRTLQHPGVVRWLASGRFDDSHYLAVELAEGSTLDAFLKDRGRLAWREVVDLAIRLCDPLQYIHEHNIIHGNLKPSKIFINGDGRLVLTGFGLAKNLDLCEISNQGWVVGTPAYLAPEQIRGTPSTSHKTDLYALGVLLYQLLTGKLPFTSDTPLMILHAHLNEPPPRARSTVPEVPGWLDDLILSLMAKAPGGRPGDAATVAQILRLPRDPEPASVQSESAPSPVPTSLFQRLMAKIPRK